MKAVYKLNADCGRSGTLDGLFIAHKEHVMKLIETKLEVYFGEVLGKHSEVFGNISYTDVIFVSDEDSVIRVIEENSLENGFNPFDYRFINASETLGYLYDDNTMNDISVGELFNMIYPVTP